MLALACVLILAFAFTACDNDKAPATEDSKAETPAASSVEDTSATDSGAQQDAALNTFVMEAEYVDFTGLEGAALSGDAAGAKMIYGYGTDDEKAKGWSNGYFVGYTHKEGLKFAFNFTSDRAVKNATIILRLGNEWGVGGITFDPDSFEIKLNDTVIDYNGIYLETFAVNEMHFEDKTITTKANIKEGANVLTLEVLENELANSRTTGPMIDCVKIVAKANFDWTPITGNPASREEDI